MPNRIPLAFRDLQVTQRHLGAQRDGVGILFRTALDDSGKPRVEKDSPTPLPKKTSCPVTPPTSRGA